MGNFVSTDPKSNTIHKKLKQLFQILDDMFYDDMEKSERMKEYMSIGKELMRYNENIKVEWVNRIIRAVMEFRDKNIHMFMLESLLYFAKHGLEINYEFVPDLPFGHYFQCIPKDQEVMKIVKTESILMLENAFDKQKCSQDFTIRNVNIKSKLKGIYTGFLHGNHHSISVMPGIRNESDETIENLQVYQVQVQEKLMKLKYIVDVMYFENTYNFEETIGELELIIQEISKYSDNIELKWIDMFASQVTQYREPEIVKFMFLSLLFVCRHVSYVASIIDYTKEFYRIVNPFLDFYMNPNDERYMQDALIPQYMDEMQQEKFVKLIGMFDEQQLPNLPLEEFYRCVKATEKFPFTASHSVNYRISSTSLYAPSKDLLKRDNCPVSGQEGRLDQVLTNEDPNLRALFIGFLSSYPYEHEVLLGPGLQFKLLQQKDLTQFYNISHIE